MKHQCNVWQCNLCHRPSPNELDSSSLPSTDDVELSTSLISPDSVRPYPKAPPRPQGKGKRRVKACILTEDPDAIQMLIDKEAKKEKKRKVAENKKQTGNRSEGPKKTMQLKCLTNDNDDSGSDSQIEMELNDSSEYSDEDFDDLTNEPQPVETTPNIFQDKAPEVGDYVLVELPVEEGKNKGTMFNYIAKILSLNIKAS